MSKILVNTLYINKEEIADLKEHLEADCWLHQELTSSEVKGLISIINYVVNNRATDEASDLSYTELLELKNKLQK